ncbi:DUF1064 domain-containing protein [Paenibacillus rigui]|uniref:DUF1064 domain-containing protein n=1 Tax=Paenibacillus rigui TaxID=554312 RepID=A0A229UL02_9BACL|nr:DUF1064 domain-containing protein [Paenibacillus rigui]OXM83984.1 hypothetical protein CF651_23005 [Paenibacillus rigui]
MKKKHKYGAKQVIVTEDLTIFEVEQLEKFNITDVKGIKFDSKSEGQYYQKLKRMEQRGEIKSIQPQPTFVLQDKPKIKYSADFLVEYIDGRTAIYDVKGVETTAFRLKVRLFKAKFPDLKLILVKKQGSRFVEVPA